MGDKVERELSGTIPILNAARRAKILTRAEVSDIVRKRRHHEYNLLRKNVSRADFLHYAAFERELSSILKKRAIRRELEKPQIERTVNKTAARVNLIYSRAVEKFRFDDDLWLHYARHCITMGSTRAAARVFAKAIAYRNDSERIWLAAIAFHFDTKGDTTGARTLAQRALRALPSSAKLWKEYFRLELCYLGKLVARRLVIGISPDAGESNEPAPIPNTSVDLDMKSKSNSEQSPSSDAMDSGYKSSDDTVDQNTENDSRIMSNQSTNNGVETKELSTSNANLASSSEPEQAPVGGPAEKDDNVQSHQTPIDTEGQDVASEQDGKLEEVSASGAERDASSSGSEESDEESLSSESSAETPDEDNVKLTFWEGGVPFSVFRNASKRLKLSYLDRAEFWGVASSTPFVPPKLLSHMLKFMKADNLECHVVQIITIREPWDIDRTTRKRSMRNKVDEEKGEIYLSESDKNALATHAFDVTELLSAAISSAQFARLPDPKAIGVRALLRSFLDVVNDTCDSVKFKDAMKEVSSLFESRQTQGMIGVEAPETEGDTTSQDMKKWSLAKFEAVLQNAEDGFVGNAELYEALKHNLIVPFRSLEQDRLICLYLMKECDKSRIRSFTSAFLALPPATMESLKAAINAELRIYANSSRRDITPAMCETNEEVVPHVRQLFKKATSLPAAKRDVDLWLSYVDFERSVSGDGREASKANWKATKVLMASLRESFTERQTLRNLAH